MRRESLGRNGLRRHKKGRGGGGLAPPHGRGINRHRDPIEILGGARTPLPREHRVHYGWTVAASSPPLRPAGIRSFANRTGRVATGALVG